MIIVKETPLHTAICRQFRKNPLKFESYEVFKGHEAYLHGAFAPQIMVYGCKVFGNVINGTNIPASYTIDNSQLPLFRLDHTKICNRANWWLRVVVSSTNFAHVNSGGDAHCTSASHPLVGVRPAFGICA